MKDLEKLKMHTIIQQQHKDDVTIPPLLHQASMQQRPNYHLAHVARRTPLIHNLHKGPPQHPSVSARPSGGSSGGKYNTITLLPSPTQHHRLISPSFNTTSSNRVRSRSGGKLRPPALGPRPPVINTRGGSEHGVRRLWSPYQHSGNPAGDDLGWPNIQGSAIRITAIK